MTALKTYMRIAAEERAWAYHLSTDRAEADYWNGIRLAKQAGREEGREEGRKDGQNKTARNMLADKLPPEKIAQYTGLSVEDIRALAAEPAAQGT